MILHIFTQVSDYSIEFLKMLNEKFEPAEHVIVFRSKTNKNIPQGNLQNIRFITSRRELIAEMPELLKNCSRLIFHSFPVSRSLFFWYRYSKYMSKAIWSVWGQDAYWYNYAKRSPENWLYEWLRTRLIRRIRIIFCPVKRDYDFITKHYKTRAQYVYGIYPIPTDFEYLRKLRHKKKEDNIINIQVGNSATKTNNTEEVLRFLSRFKNKNIKVFCPLSYGDCEYARKISEIGSKLLGDRFTPLLALMDRESYAQFISSIDVLIMNHKRQQGLGNIFSYLYLGKKVYIRADNQSFDFFDSNGIKIYDTRELFKSNNLNTLTDMKQSVSELNIRNTESIISADNVCKGWKKILNNSELLSE